MNKYFKFNWIGSIIGALSPILGLFVGLQISPILGNIMMAPWIILSSIFDVPLADFEILLHFILYFIWIVFWIFVINVIFYSKSNS